MTIVCLGDSLTYGYGLKRQEVWTSLLEKKHGIKIINKGINGDSTSGMMARFFRDVVENTPSHVIIMGGANDFAQGVSINSVQSNIATMIYQSLHYNIMPVIGIQPAVQAEMAKECFPIVDDFQKVNYGLAELRKWIISFVQANKLPSIDFFKEIDRCITKENINDLFLDGLHFTAKGNEIMAEIADITRFVRLRVSRQKERDRT